MQPRPEGFSLKKLREKPWGRGCPLCMPYGYVSPQMVGFFRRFGLTKGSLPAGSLVRALAKLLAVEPLFGKIIFPEFVQMSLHAG